MNPAAMMQIMTALKKFESTHPKFVAFIKTMFGKGITEGTIIELTVINPGQDPVTNYRQYAGTAVGFGIGKTVTGSGRTLTIIQCTIRCEK